MSCQQYKTLCAKYANPNTQKADKKYTLKNVFLNLIFIHAYTLFNDSVNSSDNMYINQKDAQNSCD